ncbi:MAG: SIR2 family protein [Deltaproteobacteria bacterium]|nr:SIR2 family protein [Deltaproteobacteria bacterium]
MPFDPLRQLNFLKQILVQDKASIGFLLSAGCGVAIRSGDTALIPDIDGLTQAVVAELDKGECKACFKTVISHFEEDNKSAPNVEKLLSHIRLLEQVAGCGEVRGLKITDLEKMESQICTTIATIVDQELLSQDTPHHHLARWTISAPRSLPVEIFTTNYDLLLEQALEESEVPYFDGFSGARRAFFDLTSIEQDHLPPREQLPPRLARLWKLHGSINWRLVKDADDKAFVVRSSLPLEGDSLLIHPSHLKYEQSRRMPYLAMMDRLRSFVSRKHAFLIICGYSFGDDHVNEAIAQGLRGNPNATAFALQFGKLDDYAKGVALAQGTSNLSILATDGAVLGTKRDEWICAANDAIDEGIGVPAIEWCPIEGDDEKKRASLKLGDFQILGKLFVDMMGSRGAEREPDE